jgi:phosphate transport system substrate-binding protein
MYKLTVAAVYLIAATLGLVEANAQSRDQIRIVGSSTVFPFATAVAEEFGRTTQFKTPIVEATGSGGGLKLFCSGIGTSYPDITNASRRIKASEVDLCRRNGVIGIVEVKIGFDGIVLASSKRAPKMNISLRELYLALAAQVPAAGTSGGPGNMIRNPYRKWSDINPALPSRPIVILGPPPTSGTRDAFNELALEAGCDTFPAMHVLKETDDQAYKALCRGVREDGPYTEAGENDNLIVQKLQTNPDAIGVFGFSFLDQNADVLMAYSVSTLPGDSAHPPTFEEIADGDYPISRSLYIYAKKAHVGVIPGIQEFLSEFTSDKAAGEFGYLSDRGLIPLPQSDRNAYEQAALSLSDLVLD